MLLKSLVSLSVLWESQCQKRELEQPDVVVVPACHSSTWQAEAGGIPQMWGYPDLIVSSRVSVGCMMGSCVIKRPVFHFSSY